MNTRISLANLARTFGHGWRDEEMDRGWSSDTDVADVNQTSQAAFSSTASPRRRQGRSSLITASLLIAFQSAVVPAAAEPIDVDLELVLAVDASNSIDVDENNLQRQGYARALRQPEITRAIALGAHGRIALTYIEWGDPGRERVIVPWTIVATLSDAVGFAAQVAVAPLTQAAATSISSGLLFAAEQFRASRARSFRQVVDVSGDGPNNLGPPVNVIRDRLAREGITINGLAITVKDGEGFGWYPDRGYDPDILPNYYRDCVIGGPGSFLITVDDPASLEMAIRRKLVLEISGLPARVLRAAETVRTPLVDCQIGEKHLYPPDPGHPRSNR